MDRRTTLKWILAASTSAPSLKTLAFTWGAGPTDSLISAYVPTAQGYGTDPQLQNIYKPGEMWPLTFTPEQRRMAATLTDLIIPADDYSPSASQIGVVDFLDEWISAPYKLQRDDRALVMDGLQWLDTESKRRFSAPFVSLSEPQQCAVCDDICYLPKAQPQYVTGAKFFARYRDLTAGGFYTTPEGRKDLQYVGNTPLPRFDGPTVEVLKQVGLA